jgi:hypothetical protein
MAAVMEKAPQRGGLLKTLLKWHWISSAMCLVGMMLFAITGITLNHASQIEAKPSITRSQATAPAPVLAELRSFAESNDGAKLPLTPKAGRWAQGHWKIDVAGATAEWSVEEVYIPLPRPGGDAWLRIGLEDGAAEYELTDRGWVSWLNDLHKGRNTGKVWFWFIDVLAVACLVFCITGLLILKIHAQHRALTWPLVGFGLALPALIAILFIH